MDVVPLQRFNSLPVIEAEFEQAPISPLIIRVFEQLFKVLKLKKMSLKKCFDRLAEGSKSINLKRFTDMMFCLGHFDET